MLNDESPLSDALGELVVHPFAEADDQTLIRAATICWYSDASLEQEIFAFLKRGRSELEIRRAGYLLERFTRFSCMSDERARECFSVLRDVFPLRRDTVYTKPARSRIDELAACWGLTEGLGLKVQAILPYQTRHVVMDQLIPDAKLSLSSNTAGTSPSLD